MPQPWSTVVYGPAYLDRVLRVDRSILPDAGRPLDRSVEALRLQPGDAGQLTLADVAGNEIRITLSEYWPGPTGRIELNGVLASENRTTPWSSHVHGSGWNDDLGGMGAGYACALGGQLIWAAGNDSMGQEVSARLNAQAIIQTAVHGSWPTSDWTLLISSGVHGDKLAIGFRGCHASLQLQDLPLTGLVAAPDAIIVTGLPNRISAEILSQATKASRNSQQPGRPLRVFAPAMRNAIDREYPIERLASDLDVLSCNAGEWGAMTDADRSALEESAWLQILTDAERGAQIRVRQHSQLSAPILIPAFPRIEPPRDTNRAGETFTSTILRAILDTGAGSDFGADPLPFQASPDWWRETGQRASAAAALVLDQERFGFPTQDAIEAALKQGVVSPHRQVAPCSSPGTKHA